MLPTAPSALPGDPPGRLPRLLCFDTATDTVHVAAVHGEQVQCVQVAGGPQASATALPAAQTLLAALDLTWTSLDAVAFGRGPGAFTGLRTACSLAQGLALAASCPVIPLDTLMAVAEDARLRMTPEDCPPGSVVWVVQDARMDEMYVGAYRWEGAQWAVAAEPQLWPLTLPAQRWAQDAGGAALLLAGNGLSAYPQAFVEVPGRRCPEAAPTGRALAALARRLWARGASVDAALALPVYVRDKVAQTMQERKALKREAGA